MNPSKVESSAIPGTGAAATAFDVAPSPAAERSAPVAYSLSDSERIDHILITMRRALEQLEAVGPVDAEFLDGNSTAGLVIERVLANLMDMTFDINCHISRANFGCIPQSFSESCASAVRSGLIDPDLASELMPADGPHHVVMQLCLDAEPGDVEEAVARALSAFRAFERRATDWAGPALPSDVV